MELLKKLYEIHSPSGKEKRIKQFIKRYILTNIPHCKIESDKIGNLYITKGESSEYPCIVAHLDQVQDIHSSDFKAIETEEIIFGYSAKNRQQEGIGADDKNGVWVCLKTLEKCDYLKIAFFVQEEIGCIGSSQSDITFFDDCRFVLQADRKGHSDFITTIGWSPLCSEEFVADCEIERFGYKEATGMITDVGELKHQGLPISVANISCGYYEPHTDQEFTVKADLLNSLALVENIIETCKKVYPHKNKDLWSYDNDYIDEYFEMEMIVEQLYNLDQTITADEVYSEYYEIYKSIKLEDIEEMLFSQNRRCLNY